VRRACQVRLTETYNLLEPWKPVTPMAASSAPVSDQALISAWKRDYRLSRAILVAGVVILVAVCAFGFWATATGNYPTSFGPGLAFNLLGTAGFSLFFVGAIFAFHNWSLLREARRLTGPARGTG
jgi:hypothetical protein